MKRIAAMLALSLVLLLPLSACGGMNEEYAMCYVQGTLDQNYLGTVEEDFLELIDTSEEEVAQAYEESLSAEAQFFLTSFVESQLPTEVEMRLINELVEMYRQIYAHSRYTVDSAAKMENSTFSVKVTVEPIDIFHLVADAMANGAADELNSSYPDQMTDEEYLAYEVDWVELFMDVTYEKLPELGYLEAQSTLVQVVLGEKNFWSIPSDDFWALDALIIDYNLY